MSNDDVNRNLQKIADHYYDQLQKEENNPAGRPLETPNTNGQSSGGGLFGKLFSVVFFIGGAIFWLYVLITWLF